jgi:hypothetical protein
LKRLKCLWTPISLSETSDHKLISKLGQTAEDGIVMLGQMAEDGQTAEDGIVMLGQTAEDGIVMLGQLHRCFFGRLWLVILDAKVV